jgi:hypothetical protein
MAASCRIRQAPECPKVHSPAPTHLERPDSRAPHAARGHMRGTMPKSLPGQASTDARATSLSAPIVQGSLRPLDLDRDATRPPQRGRPNLPRVIRQRSSVSAFRLLPLAR